MAARRYDPDLGRRQYSIRQIAGSYQMSHLSIENMPSDGEFLYALQINGHKPEMLQELKDQYSRISRAILGGNDGRR